MIQNYIAVFATVATTLLVVDVHPTEAKPVTYDFTVVVTEGSLAGKTFKGSFRYDDEVLTGVGREEIDIADGLTVTMNFFGQDYTEKADQEYPTFPKLIFEDGEIQQLDFWIEPGKRLVWWGRPGWKIELSPRDGVHSF
jgi:hypothetical protein